MPLHSVPPQEATPVAPPPLATVQAPTLGAPATAAEMYEAMRAQARVLDDQIRSLERSRERLATELRNPAVTGADRTGLEARLGQIDNRISQVEAQRLVADQQVALAAAQPGAVVVPPPPPDNIRDDVLGFLAIITILVAVPLTFAWARRIWRRQTVVQAMPPELGDRLATIERAVDTVAVEVERIGEGQRFVTQLLAARRDPAGRIAAPVDADPR